MYKLSTIFHATLFVASVATPSYASKEEVTDPKGLLRVSSNLYQQMNLIEPNTNRQMTLAALPAEDDVDVPSNNNAPRNVVQMPAAQVEATLTNAEEDELLDYLFLQENRFNPDLRQFNPRLKIGPLLQLLRILDQGGELTANQLAQRVKVEGVTSYKLCQRYKAKEFIHHDVETGLYSITPKGQFLLENIEACYQPIGDKGTKRTGEPVKHLEKAVSTVLSKKLRQTEKDDADDLDIDNFKKPAVHHGILEVMGSMDNYMDPEEIYNAMGDLAPGKSWSDAKYSLTYYYLREHVKREWLAIKKVRDRDVYAITKKGHKARAALAKLLESEEDEDEVDLGDDEFELSSSLSIEPGKKRKSTSASSSEREEDEEMVEVSVPVKKSQTAKPASIKGSIKVPEIKSIARAPQVINPVANPVQKHAVEMRQEEPAQPALTLDEVPAALRSHLLGQIMLDNEAYINNLQESVFDGIYQQLGRTLVQKFETGPGNALKEYLKGCLTVTIKKNN